MFKKYETEEERKEAEKRNKREYYYRKKQEQGKIPKAVKKQAEQNDLRDILFSLKADVAEIKAMLTE